MSSGCSNIVNVLMVFSVFVFVFFLFFFNDTATTEIYTFPYTTLFRSYQGHNGRQRNVGVLCEMSPAVNSMSVQREHLEFFLTSGPVPPGLAGV